MPLCSISFEHHQCLRCDRPLVLRNNLQNSTKHLKSSSFGSPCYVYDHRPNTSGWDKKALLATMVGYSDRLDAYRVYVHGSKTIWVSKCVKFLSKPPKARPLQPQDTEFQPNSDSESSSEEVTDQIVHSSTPSDNGDMAEDFSHPPVQSQQDSSEESSDSDENQRSHPSPSKMRLRQSSERRPPRRFDIEMAEVMTPTSYADAMRSPYSKEWHKAMRSELDNIKNHKVWSLVDRPRHKKPISVRWVYRYKPHKEKEEERFRARLVARGFLQRPGQDYHEIFSPVMRWDSLRLLLALCAANSTSQSPSFMLRWLRSCTATNRSASLTSPTESAACTSPSMASNKRPDLFTRNCAMFSSA